MIHLLTYPAMFGQFAASPFCTKAALLLTLSGQAWQREDMLDPRKMPYGKLPAIRVAGKTIADSDNIRACLEQNGADVDAGLSEIDRSTARAFIRMAEEHIYFHLLLDRWGNGAVWPLIRDTYFAGIPGVMRGFVAFARVSGVMRSFVAGRLRREVLRGMHAQGLGRFTAPERLARLEPDLHAVRTRLAQAPYLFGERPTAADCSVGPMLGAAIATPVPTALSQRVAEDKVLADYTARVSALLD